VALEAAEWSTTKTRRAADIRTEMEIRFEKFVTFHHRQTFIVKTVVKIACRNQQERVNVTVRLASVAESIII